MYLGTGSNGWILTASCAGSLMGTEARLRHEEHALCHEPRASLQMTKLAWEKTEQVDVCPTGPTPQVWIPRPIEVLDMYSQDPTLKWEAETEELHGRFKVSEFGVHSTAANKRNYFR